MSIWEQLREPFPASEVQWRVGMKTKDGAKGLALAYIDARAVMDRLDAVVGPANWHDTYAQFGQTTICTLALRVDGEWIAKCDGAGPSDVEPEKGTISDALKRAAVKWGVFRYGYSLPAQWVELDANGRIKHPPKLPAWALPAAPKNKAPQTAEPEAPRPANGNGAMTPDQIARFTAAIDALKDQYFDTFGDALKAVGKSEADVRSIRYAKEAATVFKALEAACAAALGGP